MSALSAMWREHCRFVVSFVRDGVTLTEIGVMFDEAMTTRAEWVGKGADGFPVLEGKVVDVIGQSLIIRCGLANADDIIVPCATVTCAFLILSGITFSHSVLSCCNGSAWDSSRKCRLQKCLTRAALQLGPVLVLTSTGVIYSYFLM